MSRGRSSRRPPGDLFTEARELAVKAVAQQTPAAGTLSEARLAAAAKLELARALHHLRRTRSGRLVLDPPPTKVKGSMSQFKSNIAGDVPSEMSEMSDGVSDDGASDAPIIGRCPCDGVGGELSDLAVGGLPSYLFTRRGLSNPVLRRRTSAALKAMSPKMRRRVMARLQAVVAQNRVSGSIRGAYPSVSGYSGGYPSVSGWTGVSVGRCPLSQVAGALTP